MGARPISAELMSHSDLAGSESKLKTFRERLMHPEQVHWKIIISGMVIGFFLCVGIAGMKYTDDVYKMSDNKNGLTPQAQHPVQPLPEADFIQESGMPTQMANKMKPSQGAAPNTIFVREDAVPWHKMPDGTMMPGVSMMKPMHMMPDGDWMQGLSIKAMKKMNKHVKEIPSPVVDVETTSKSQTAKAIRASMLKGNKNTILVHEDAVPWHMTPDGSMMPGVSTKHPIHMMPNGKWMKGASHKEAMAQMKKQFAYVAEPV